MIGYIIGLFKGAYEQVYEQISPDYRLAKFDAMVESGELEKMCGSEIERRFHITREGNF